MPFFKNGLAVAFGGVLDEYGRHEDNAWLGIIDTNGDFILPISNVGWIYWSLYTFTRSEGEHAFVYGLGLYDSNGEKIKQHDYAMEYSTHLDGDTYATISGIVNMRTGEVYFEKQLGVISAKYPDLRGLPWNAPNELFQVFQPEAGRFCAVSYTVESLSWWEADGDNEVYHYIRPKYRFGALDKNGIVLDFKYDMLQWVGDYIAAVEGDYGGLIRPDGTWFVKVDLRDAVD